MKVDKQWILIACFSLMIPTGIRLGLEPYNSENAGMLTILGLILLTRKIRTISYGKIFLLSLFISLAISFISFPWLATGIKNLTGIQKSWAWLLVIPYSIFFQLKIGFVLLLSRFFFSHYPGREIWLLAGLALLSDLAFYQVFPWYYGNLFSGDPFALQFASIAGVYGIGFLYFLITYESYEWLKKLICKIGRISVTRPDAYSRLFDSWLPILIILLIYSYGFHRLLKFRPDGELVKIGFIQPNTGLGLQKKKKDAEFASHALNLVANLSLKAIYEAQGQLDLLILPESAIPFYATKDSSENRQHKTYSPTFHGLIAFLSREGQLDVLYNEMEWQQGKLLNQASLFSRSGVQKQVYTKQILVPFGEYIPPFIPFTGKLFLESSRYSAGGEKKRLTYSYITNRRQHHVRKWRQQDLQEIQKPQQILSNWPKIEPAQQGWLATFLCYEAMFPEYVRELVQQGEIDFLVNLVNDSWFGNELENYQHSDAAKIRAVETGRYLIRVSLSGVSSVTSPLGRAVLKPTEIEEKAIRIFAIPRLPQQSTLYLRYGNYMNFALIGLSLLIYLIGAWRFHTPIRRSIKSEK